MANPADTTSVSFPDLMFVNSKITSPKTLSTETFFEWYDEDHIPDVYDSGKVGGAWRYFDVQEDTERPYLALYDIDNVTFRTSPNFAAIRVTSAVLPGTGAIFDMADFDIRFYSRTQLYEPAGTKPGERAPALHLGHSCPVAAIEKMSPKLTEPRKGSFSDGCRDRARQRHNR
jgi:hypothetical protein